ncbi:MAG: acyl-CoA/acyl-ACP dehydrogenase [Helicobacter sp.]|nr:acyl-CoA/acyl-ACP dehydrogenase [Helicobacter sp.]
MQKSYEQTFKSLHSRLIAIHQGEYPQDILENLGKLGFYNAFLNHKEKGLPQAIKSIYEVSKVCGNTGFCVWCQNVLAWYLFHNKNTQELFCKVSKGEILGGTGLSNPIKSFNQIESIKLKAQKTEGGYLINGTLPWVSNIQYGHYFGIIAQLEEDYIMGIVQCDKNHLTLKEEVHFIALEGSATQAVYFKDYFLKEAFVLKWSEISSYITPGFILMQGGLGLGILQKALEILEQHKDSKNQINAFLPYDISNFYAQKEALTNKAFHLACNPYDLSKSYLHQCLKLKFDLATLLLESAQAVMLATGTKGYLKDSLASKLLLEAYFVAIVTPSLKHIQKILKG